VTSSRNAQTRSPTPPPEIGEREYVLNLHRLGRDLPWNLPEPPAASAFHMRWALEEQPRGPAEDNIFARPPIKDLPLPEDQLRLLVAVLGAERGLVPLWNWQLNGVPASWCHR
jgi:hypothetical protein